MCFYTKVIHGFYYQGRYPFEGKRGTYLCIFQKKKVLSVCSSVFVLTLILSMTVFAAEKAPKPQLYATFLGIDPSRCGDCSRVDHKRSI